MHKVIKVENKKDQNIIWLKILGILGRRDLLLGTVDVSPINSSVYNSENDTKDTFGVLYNQIVSFGEKNPIILGRDFNACMRNLKDVIIAEKNKNTFLQIPEFLCNKTGTKERVNQDKKKNEFGYELRDIYIGAKLNILNGRTIGDLLVRYTFIGPNECSTVDYVLVSEDLGISRNSIKSINVKELTRFWDHCPTTVSLIETFQRPN